jgi:ACT domain-containing protein
MKTLLNIAVVVFFIYILSDVDFEKTSNEGIRMSNPTQIETITHVEDSPKKTKRVKINRSFKIVCLGDVNFNEFQDTISDVVNILRSEGIAVDLEYHSHVESLDEYMITDENGNLTEILDNQKFLQQYSDNKSVIFLTNKRIFDSNMRDYVRGYSTGYNVIVRVGNGFIKETMVHELGHIFSLRHCDDLSCIMAINNDEYDSGTFCNKCKSQLNLYE